MLGNFTYCNPTKLYFGEAALEGLREELPKFGKTVQLIYGGGSIKRNGIYEAVTAMLEACGKVVVEDGGVMPNPTIDRVREGVQLARTHGVDLLLAVGGGSCCDYAKAVSVSVHCEEDPWDRFMLRMEDAPDDVVPVGCVLTMVGTGSEMNAGFVISNPGEHLKLAYDNEDARLMPRFAILNPRYTMTLPRTQMVAGIYDIFNHLCEQYFSGEDDNTSDYISEGLMRSVVAASRVALEDPSDYEARSNLMWTATWALNTLVSRGKSTDWMVHALGQAVGAYTDATHGMTLSAVSLPYYHLIMHDGLAKFKRFAQEVWRIDTAGKSDEEIAEAGLCAMEAWMQELGLVMHLRDLGVDETMLEGIAGATVISEDGYKVLSHTDVMTVLRESL